MDSSVKPNIQMVNLNDQYLKIKQEVDSAIENVINSCKFINGPDVTLFAQELADFTGAKYVIPCGNGTDALQIALMALLQPGDEVLVPAFTYVASAEVIGLLGMKPVMVDVSYDTFNIAPTLSDTAVTAPVSAEMVVERLEKALSPKTKAIIPVHLFGQCADMELIMDFARKHNLYVIEDTAQAIGAEFTFKNGVTMQAGTIGDIGCTSFFPSKNLGCYGDGGAIFTNNPDLAAKIKTIANHGQKVKYHHSVIGCNSRLDTIQAAILRVKLKHLKEYSASRQKAAAYYNKCFSQLSPQIIIPANQAGSTHVYHQYTLKIPDVNLCGKNGSSTLSTRDSLKEFLGSKGIPAMIYYPLPLQEQEAFKAITRVADEPVISRALAYSVLSLPMHTEITSIEQDYIVNAVAEFFNR